LRFQRHEKVLLAVAAVYWVFILAFVAGLIYILFKIGARL